MKMLDVVIGLEKMRDAREAWGKGRTEFFAAYDTLLRLYLYEACANYMGVPQIAKALGVSPRTIRSKMRDLGFDPKSGKRALSAKASEAMQENAALMGIDPSEMDLTSPLAYLPMGSVLRQQLQDQRLEDSRVTELPDETPEDRDFNEISNFIYGELPWRGETFKVLANQIAGRLVGRVKRAPGDSIAYKQGIIDFVTEMGVAYRKHSAEATWEDMVFACIRYGIEPEVWFDDPDDAAALRASVARHRELGTYAK